MMRSLRSEPSPHTQIRKRKSGMAYIIPKPVECILASPEPILKPSGLANRLSRPVQCHFTIPDFGLQGLFSQNEGKLLYVFPQLGLGDMDQRIKLSESYSVFCPEMLGKREALACIEMARCLLAKQFLAGLTA